MGIGMSWGSVYGQAWGEFPTVDACAAALCRSVRRVYARVGPSFRGALLRQSAGRLRCEMCTDGLHRVVRCQEWHGEHGGVWVSLYPRCDERRAGPRHLR
jgi:hypothetical protein